MKSPCGNLFQVNARGFFMFSQSEQGELLDVAVTAAREIAGLPEDMPEHAKRGFVAHQPRLFEA